MPGESDRRRIWEGMLPAEAELEPVVLELDVLARDYEIAGGSIRNSVSAAFIGANEGVPIGPRQLKLGLRRAPAKGRPRSRQ